MIVLRHGTNAILADRSALGPDTYPVVFSGQWPRDPRLDPFRKAVWELSRDGHVEAFLTTEVTRMRSLPFFWVKQEWLWYQVNWLDGRRDHPREDYGPGWYAVAELEQGRFEHDEIHDSCLTPNPSTDQTASSCGSDTAPIGASRNNSAPAAHVWIGRPQTA